MFGRAQIAAKPWASALAGAVAGLIVTMLAYMWRVGFDANAVAATMNHGWFFWVLAGIIPGASFGVVIWALIHRTERLSRAMRVSIVVTWIGWAAFIVSTPPVTSEDFANIAEARARRDAGGGLDLMTDQPTVLAGRWFPGYGLYGITGRALLILTGPAVFVTADLVVPWRFAGTFPTRGESYAIAVIAFAESTAFWPAAICLAGSLRRREAA